MSSKLEKTIRHVLINEGVHQNTNLIAFAVEQAILGKYNISPKERIANGPVVLYFDGNVENNGQPDSKGTGTFTIYIGDKCVKNHSFPVDTGDTNNKAEYKALIKGLGYIEENFPHCDVTIKGDSQLVIKQMNREWECKNSDLRILRSIAHDLSVKCHVAKYQWVPREQNKAG